MGAGSALSLAALIDGKLEKTDFETFKVNNTLAIGKKTDYSEFSTVSGNTTDLLRRVALLETGQQPIELPGGGYTTYALQTDMDYVQTNLELVGGMATSV